MWWIERGRKRGKRGGVMEECRASQTKIFELLSLWAWADVLGCVWGCWVDVWKGNMCTYTRVQTAIDINKHKQAEANTTEKDTGKHKQYIQYTVMCVSSYKQTPNTWVRTVLSLISGGVVCGAGTEHLITHTFKSFSAQEWINKKGGNMTRPLD